MDNNPFSSNHPTTVQTSLISLALFARFDPSGRYIGAGRYDGSACIWDLETRAQVRKLVGHVKAVTSLDWSRNSRYVLTSSKDWNVIIWDLANECDPIQRKTTIRFDVPVVSSYFHPRNSKIVLAVLLTGEAYLTDLRQKHRCQAELIEVQDDSDDELQQANDRMGHGITVARFDPSGKHIFAGTRAGSILVFNSRTKTMVARHKIPGAGSLKGMDFIRSGRRLVTNSSDRTLRQFNLPPYPPPSAEGDYIEQELKPTNLFNDPINKTAWHTMSYSPTGAWLAGGAADSAAHKIYIWDISNDGQFATTLDGGRDPLTFVHWHPLKSVVASTTRQGNILIWHCPTPERWGAFAGDFEEIDENIEYDEKEDEFDIEDEAEVQKRKMKAEEQEVDVDTIVEITNPTTNGSQKQQDGAQSQTNASSDGHEEHALPLESTSTPLVNGNRHGSGGDANPPPAEVVINGDVKPNTNAELDVNDIIAVSEMGTLVNGNGGSDVVDEDTTWADEDPDEDTVTWVLKVIMEDDSFVG